MKDNQERTNRDYIHTGTLQTFAVGIGSLCSSENRRAQIESARLVTTTAHVSQPITTWVDTVKANIANRDIL